LDADLFHVRLLALRQAAGIASDAELADRAGVPRSTLTDLSCGRKLPSYETLLRLTTGLGADTLAVWDGTSAERNPDPQPRPRRKKQQIS
jgi:transcriptional regulator with XRE-family HTH domain